MAELDWKYREVVPVDRYDRLAMWAAIVAMGAAIYRQSDAFAPLATAITLLAVAWPTFRRWFRWTRSVGFSDAGVTIVPRAGQVSRLPWSEVEFTEADGSIIELPSGQVLAQVPDQRRLRQTAHALWRRYRLAEAAEPVDGAQIERLLGVEPGGRLMIRRPRPLGVLWAVIWTSVPVSAYLVTRGQPLWLGATPSLLWLATILAARWLAPRRSFDVCWAGARGIRAQNHLATINVGWDDLLSSWHEGPVAYVETVRGRLRFGTSGAKGWSLAKTTQELLAAREAGRPLPRLSDVPEAALSRARVAVEVERGLSRHAPD